MKTPTAKDKAIKETAEANGCKPFWWDGIFGWAYHCGCDDDLHHCDQQCSMISERSAQRVRGVNS